MDRKMYNDIHNWHETDIDSLQFRYKNTPVFTEFKRLEFPDEFKAIQESLKTEEPLLEEYWFKRRYWYTREIYIETYSLKEIREFVVGYYNGLDHVVEIYDKDADIIVAEIIFEQTSGMY